jgi:gliding motility-associated-like protein
MIRITLLNVVLGLLMPLLAVAQDPCDPPINASVSATGPACSGGLVTLTFALPDDDDGDGFDITYTIDGNNFTLTAVQNGQTADHFIAATTTATLEIVWNNNDDDDDVCFTVINQTIVITVSNPAVAISNQNAPACGQNNGNLTALASNGAAPYQYSLNGGPFQNSGTFNGLTSGTYTITTQDAEGCTASISTTLESSNPPSLVITNQNAPACGQNNGNLTALASNGAAPYQYSLNGGPFQNSGTFNGLTSGTYTITTQDASGCTAETSVNLTAANAPVLNISSETDPDCGQNNGSFSVAASGGVAPFQFSVNGGSFQNNGTFSGLSAGNYQVVVQDGLGCTASLVVTLANAGANLPAASIQSNTLQGCEETTFELLGNLPSGTTGNWSSDETDPSTPNNPEWLLVGLPPGSTTLTWTLSAPGCANYSEASIVISVLPPPVANQDGIFSVTSNAPLVIDVASNDVLSGQYMMRILVQPKHGTSTVNAANELEYQSFEQENLLDTVVYEICHTACPSACDTALVLFRNQRNDDPCFIAGDTSNVFTNGLTPNNDGSNDFLVFRVVSIEECSLNYANSDIVIYNRWGDIVFKADRYDNKWAGKNQKGDDLPPGVYYFILRISVNNEKKYTQFGSVILIR